MNLFLASISVFIFNIPFGYWRQHVRKFSWAWILAIHIPVPFVVLFRFCFHLGFQFYTYPFLVAAFFLGQFLGSQIYRYRKHLSCRPLTGCLIMDVFRNQTEK